MGESCVVRELCLHLGLNSIPDVVPENYKVVNCENAKMQLLIYSTETRALIREKLK